MRADGGFWRMGLDGSGRLLARGPGGNSEGRGPRRERERAGAAGGDDQRGGPAAMTDGEGRRRWLMEGPTAMTDGEDRRR